MWELTLSEDAVAFLEKLDRKTRQAILDRIRKLSLIPYRQGRPLSGPLKGFRRVRTGAYRIVFTLDYRSKTVLVVAIGHRKDIYRRLSTN